MKMENGIFCGTSIHSKRDQSIEGAAINPGDNLVIV